MLIAIAELNARTSNHVLQAHQQRTAAAVTAEAAAAVEANLVAAAGEIGHLCSKTNLPYSNSVNLRSEQGDGI